MNIRITLFVLFWTLFAGLSACKQSNQEINPSPDPTKNQTGNKPTPIGQPQGKPTTQTIGPDGGTITTSDGKLTLKLPAGALTKATLITIQPITNNAPNGVGQAYRFSPDGTQFAKPATLTLQYAKNEVAVNDPDMLFVAFQDSDQRWQGVVGSQVDTTRLQISASMPHFSDWSLEEQADLEDLMVENASGNGTKEKPLKAGQSVKLTTTIIIPPLDKKQALSESGETWSVVGGDKNGQISKTSDGYMTYTAPKQAPAQNPVTVLVEIPFQNTNKKAYLLKSIYIEGFGYFRGTIDGIAFDWEISVYTRTADEFYIIGSPERNFVPNIQFGVLSGATNPVGFYPYAERVKAGAATLAMRTNGEVGNGLLNFYYECQGDYPLVLSKGGIQIDKVERNGDTETIEGHLTGTVYRPEGKCPDINLKKSSLDVSFRIPRKVTP